MDFYSRFIEISKLSGITADDVIGLLKSIFARHGIPNEVVSDNGPQYSSQRFADFSKEYNFVHTTSSPHYPQANGEAERAVRTIKSLSKKNSDHYQALLSYRTTPLANGYSAAELLMGRKLRTTLPMFSRQLLPKLPNQSLLSQKEQTIKESQTKFDL